MWQNLRETVDLVTITEEILNGKLHFLCSATSFKNSRIGVVVNNKHNITQLKVFFIHLTDHDINLSGAILHLYILLNLSASAVQYLSCLGLYILQYFTSKNKEAIFKWNSNLEKLCQRSGKQLNNQRILHSENQRLWLPIKL